jgi:RimJ/RimL family protein N-acetyltransferase
MRRTLQEHNRRQRSRRAKTSPQDYECHLRFGAFFQDDGVEFSDAEWSKRPVGPYLIESRQDKTLLGCTGLVFETPDCAATGYVLAKDSWGQGYATEALSAVTEMARNAGILRLYALYHPENLVSERVLQKCGFKLERILTRHCKFSEFQRG